MILMRFISAGVAIALASAAHAKSPRVVTDIPPVHSLVAQVMEGVGTPILLLEPGADPHTNAMRPSQATALETADIVIAIGPALTPWLEKPLSALASRAHVVNLLELEGTMRLPYRGAHSHDHGHDEGDDTDPHAWLDPANAQIWLSAIADALSDADPDQSALYHANAENASVLLSDQVSGLQAALKVGNFGVHHDAFQYFETRFGIEPAFIVQEDGAHRPGPARIAKLRAQVAETSIACVFVESGANRGIVETVLEESDAKILELDPLGAGFEAGTSLYQQLLQNMVETMNLCR